MASKKFQYTRGGVISITSLLDIFVPGCLAVCCWGRDIKADTACTAACCLGERDTETGSANTENDIEDEDEDADIDAKKTSEGGGLVLGWTRHGPGLLHPSKLLCPVLPDQLCNLPCCLLDNMNIFLADNWTTLAGVRPNTQTASH